MFNVCQIDGLPKSLSQPPEDAVSWNPCEAAEALLERSGVTICHGGHRAFYHPGTDTIQLPPRTAFPEPAGYYSTALHELVHATAHPSRCARDLSGRFGDDRLRGRGAHRRDGISLFLRPLPARRPAPACELHRKLVDACSATTSGPIFTAAAKAQAAADYVLTTAGALTPAEPA